ncbi:pilus assembly protein [Lamprobacter modestohalophilus]|uniref:pilus assembly protein n=1 Tax=Lamprobacter modestohalophilus TaxID=1064514 RepID=UPI002ADED37C|nr:pilus assembly protein [Lamprobacter modestohalophilus]MEA1048285.1 pilus assembly protein [Lamprobacter modestohalophilus]
MKRSVTLLSSTALLATALTAGLAMAAPHGADPAQRMERMTEHLKLSEAQQAEIGTLLEQHQQQRNAERLALREQIDAQLTEEQRQARAARMEERVERRLTRMTERLDLSSDQAREMRDLFVEKRENPSLTRTEMRKRMAAVLSEEQLSQLEQTRRRSAAQGDWKKR